MPYAFVTTNLLDLRAEPSNQSERLSQLLFADTLEIFDEQGGFARIKQADGYTGWADSRFLATVPATVAINYRKSLNAVIGVSEGKILNLRTAESVPPHFLYYGTPIHLSSQRGPYAVVSTPDLKRYRISGSALKPIDPKRVQTVSGPALVREAKRFLGVPYVWGGISPAGFDCSGLVRTVCGRFGLYLPRDTKDQIEVGRHIDRSDIRTGDLLFFKRHVGFAIGTNQIIHASRGGGGVRINALVAGALNYRPDLDQDFQEARRILK